MRLDLRLKEAGADLRKMTGDSTLMLTVWWVMTVSSAAFLVYSVVFMLSLAKV
jgi:hypothetical protein